MRLVCKATYHVLSSKYLCGERCGFWFCLQINCALAALWDSCGKSVTFGVTQGIRNCICVFFSFIRLVTPNFFSIIRFPVQKTLCYIKNKKIVNVRTSSKTRFSTPSRANILVTPGLQKLQEVGFNASPGLKQIYNWSFTHLLPRKFKIPSLLKLEMCFLRLSHRHPIPQKWPNFVIFDGA